MDTAETAAALPQDVFDDMRAVAAALATSRPVPTGGGAPRSGTIRQGPGAATASAWRARDRRRSDAAEPRGVKYLRDDSLRRPRREWLHFFSGGSAVSTSALFEAALALSETDRIHLVEKLLDSLGPETDGVDEASFLAELRRRSDEIEQGQAEFIPWLELKNGPF